MEEYTPEQVRGGNAPGLIGFQEIKCHNMVFDVKIDFTRKARFVAGGHMTEAPAVGSSGYYSSLPMRFYDCIYYLPWSLPRDHGFGYEFGT